MGRMVDMAVMLQVPTLEWLDPVKDKAVDQVFDKCPRRQTGSHQNYTDSPVNRRQCGHTDDRDQDCRRYCQGLGIG